MKKSNFIYKDWQDLAKKGKKALAVLIDPDKAAPHHLQKMVDFAAQGLINYFFVGGSLLTKDQISTTISFLKEKSNIPVLIFPGSTLQIDEQADGILLLSMISGRNSDLLIGKHVEAAPILKKSDLEIVSTGYILVDGGKPTSVSYMSNTQPIPHDKSSIATATAMAGEMLGLKSIYLEAGSGAEKSISAQMIKSVKQQIAIPLIVGGGIRSAETAKEVAIAGADIIVIGTQFEQNPDLIPTIFEAIN